MDRIRDEFAVCETVTPQLVGDDSSGDTDIRYESSTISIKLTRIDALTVAIVDSERSGTNRVLCAGH